MGNLADFIEEYLRRILEQEKKIELQRRELAKMFRCAPSQINYVLETRFTLNRGYLIESKRGGGGYIRISRIQWRTSNNLPDLIEEVVPSSLSLTETERLLENLVEKGLLSSDEALLAGQAISHNFIEPRSETEDFMRAKFIKALLLVLGGKNKE